jgi:hypothetical protein
LDPSNNSLEEAKWAFIHTTHGKWFELFQIIGHHDLTVQVQYNPHLMPEALELLDHLAHVVSRAIEWALAYIHPLLHQVPDPHQLPSPRRD